MTTPLLPLRRTRELLQPLTAVIAVLALVTVVITSQHTAGRLTRDEHETCIIQARGLPASRLQTHAWADIQTLISIPHPHTGPPPPPRLVHLAENLRTTLAAYTKIETKQPATRTC
jgi:hypothetical protein